MEPDWRKVAYPRYFVEGQRTQSILWSFAISFSPRKLLRSMLSFASRYVFFSFNVRSIIARSVFQDFQVFFMIIDYVGLSCPINYIVCSDHGSMIRGRIFVKTVFRVYHIDGRLFCNVPIYFHTRQGNFEHIATISLIC